jgi:hypothetical protein
MSEFRKPLATDSMEDHAEQHGHAYDEIQAIKENDVVLENKVNLNEDKISALNHSVDALAQTRAGGEWILSSDASTQGTMALGTQDLTGLDNRIYINVTDANGVVANMSTIKVGDYIEILEEHEVLNRATQDYALYRVTIAYVDNYFDVQLSEGRGFADMGRRFLVKAFRMNEGLDVAELDSRYALKTHLHSDLIKKEADNSTYKDWLLKADGNKKNPSDLASSGHTHDYLPTTAGTHEVTQNWKIVSGGKTFLNIQGDKSHIYHLDTPGDRAHAANKGYVDDEVAKKADTHDHPYAASSHTHDYASSSHSHSYASTSHTHNYASSSHTHSVNFRSGTSSSPSLSKGEPYINTSTKVLYVGI